MRSGLPAPEWMHLGGPAWFEAPEREWFSKGLGALIAVPLAPLTVAAAGLIAITERRNPVLTQYRVGQDGEIIEVEKLHTMPPGTPETMSEGHNDHRRTRKGKILSALRVDEGPQLRNVLDGSMSTVGLRPLVKDHYDEFMESVRALDHNPDLITDPYLGELKRQGFSLEWLAKEVNAMVPSGWIDPYGIELYVRGIEDTHEARLRSNIEYGFDKGSAKFELGVLLGSLGIIKNLGHPEIILPDHSPGLIVPGMYY